MAVLKQLSLEEVKPFRTDETSHLQGASLTDCHSEVMICAAMHGQCSQGLPMLGP